MEFKVSRGTKEREREREREQGDRRHNIFANLQHKMFVFLVLSALVFFDITLNRPTYQPATGRTSPLPLPGCTPRSRSPSKPGPGALVGGVRVVRFQKKRVESD